MKKQLLFSAFLLITTGAFAQLTVKPNGSTDSFVYVKDQILFVTDDIELSKNNVNGDQVASIYLREGGQLIQGNPLAKNKGDGYLSVQQISPVTNAWAYYDWCSPVGNPRNEAGTTIHPPGNKNFGIQSIYEDQNTEEGNGTKAKQSLHIPQKEGYNEPNLTISTRWLYVLEQPGTEAEAIYDRIYANNGAKPGFGFTMKGVSEGGLPAAEASHDQLYEFRGRPNNGNFTIPVAGPEYSGSGPADVNAKMVLTGNPYPSALDLKKVFNDVDNGALSAIFYYDEDRSAMTHYYSQKPYGHGVWIPEGSPNGSFINATFYIWNAAGGSTIDPGGSIPIVRANPKRYAPIGQGFRFVGGGNGPGEGTVTIKNSHRVFVQETETGGSIFFRPNPDNSGEDEATTHNTTNDGPTLSTSSDQADTRTPQLRLYVVFDDALTRDMLLLLTNEASDGYDRGYDGLSPGGMNSDAFFPIDYGTRVLPYVIQGTDYSVNKQIPITFKLHKPSKINIQIAEEIRKPYQKVYLFDKQENTYTRLSSLNVDAIGINLPAGVYEDRFYIAFRNLNITLDTPEDELLAKEAVHKNVNFFQNNPAKQLEIRNPHGYKLKTAAVYDMAGKLVISEKNLGDNTKYSFYTGNLSDGVYLVKLQTSENITLDYKAIVHNK